VSLFIGVFVTSCVMAFCGRRSGVVGVGIAAAIGIGALCRTWLPTAIDLTVPIVQAEGWEPARWLAPLWAPWVFVGYATWYVVPFVALWSYRWRGAHGLAFGLVVLVGYVLTGAVRAEPPWMVSGYRVMEWWPPVVDILRGDVRPAAAFPSMHVAIPAVVALTVDRRWLWYAGAMSVLVVVAGEHWMIDVAAAWVLALVAVKVAEGVIGAESISAGVLGTAGVRENIRDVRDGVGVVETESGPLRVFDIRIANPRGRSSKSAFRRRRRYSGRKQRSVAD